MQYVLGPDACERRGGFLVRLPEKHRQTVALIGTGIVGKEDDISPWGTGFFVDNQRPGGSYLVTAAHIIANAGFESPFDIRLNKRGGGAQNLHVDDPSWVTHPTDDTVDVAVHRMDVPDWAEAAHVPWGETEDQTEPVPVLLLDKRFEEKNIGEGSRTYTVGLWKFLKGDRRNQPFVFTGHIGLVPDGQRVSVNRWLSSHKYERVLVEAYLVEGEPLEGASGAPVFVRRSLHIRGVPKGAKQPIWVAVQGSIWCLGLQSDAYQGKASHDYELPRNSMIPRGVNVVVPSYKIVEVLMHEKLREQRKKEQSDEDLTNAPKKTIQGL